MTTTDLERNCRRVVGLLPRAERDARGEEVLAVLMDLSAGRRRPPLGEVAAVAALSVVLRLRARAGRLGAGVPVLVAALAVVVAPWPVPHVVQHVPSLVANPVTQIVALVLMIGGTLAAATVWLLGYRRTAAALWLALAVFTVYDGVEVAVGHGVDEEAWHLGHVVVPTVLTAAALLTAALRGVPSPRPRRTWLVLVPVTIAFWTANLFLPQVTGPAALVVPAVVVASVAAVAVITGTSRVAVLVPAAVAAALSIGGLVPAWLTAVVVVSAVGMLIQGRQVAPSTSRVT